MGGLPTGWAYAGPGTPTWSSAVAHSGCHSVEITGGSQDQSAWKTLVNTGALSTGEKLQATAWAEGRRATGSNMLAVAWFSTTGTYLGNATSSPLPAGTSTWTELGVNATAPAGAAYAVLYLQSSENSGSVWFDDASATVITAGAFPALPAVPVTSGYGATLADPGFEPGRAGCRPDGCPRRPRPGAHLVVHRGPLRFLLGRDNSGSQSLASWTQSVNTGALSTGEKLQATAWAEGRRATGSNMLAVAWFGTTGTYLGNATSSPLPAGTSTWTELGVNATAPGRRRLCRALPAVVGELGQRVVRRCQRHGHHRRRFPRPAGRTGDVRLRRHPGRPGLRAGSGGLPAGWVPSAPSTGHA